MRFPDWASPGGKTRFQGSRLRREQQHATFAWGKNCHIHSTRRGKRSENLSKDQFGVLAKGTLRKLYSRIEAPWPELIEGICPLVHQMLNERRELHKIAQQATHLLSIHCLYQTPAGSARGLVKKVDEGGSWVICGPGCVCGPHGWRVSGTLGSPAACGANCRERIGERPRPPGGSHFPAACDVGERKQPIADRGCLKTGFPAVTCTRMVAGLFVPEQFRQAGENIWDLRFPMTNPCLGRAENILLVHSLKNR